MRNPPFSMRIYTDNADYIRMCDRFSNAYMRLFEIPHIRGNSSINFENTFILQHPILY